MKLLNKEFKPTSWAIDNKISIYALSVILMIFGLKSYNSLPKEQFPEIVIPTIIVNTIYPGTSPQDIENLVTRPIEKNIKSLSGVKKVKSNSIQDMSSIIVEFGTDVDQAEAKQRVKDAVDKTKSELPSDLPQDPLVMEIDFSQVPIAYLNIAGNYPLDQLKIYADELQDRIEELPEITRVDIVGALDKEVQVNLDMYRMQAAKLTFSDIDRAISSENVTISGGAVNLWGMSRNIRIVGEFKDIETIKNLTVGTSGGGLIQLKDVAEVKMGFKEQDSYARLNGENVLTLNIVKKSGKNLLDAADQIAKITEELKSNSFPKDITINITGDQSKYTRNTVNELNNTIIIGFILVVGILMFFMGVTNAFFVAVSVPLSMALAYIVMPGIDFTLNMLVMFAFIFALGIVVDDAIVVIENTHRIFMKTNLPITKAAKLAAGEVFVPILAGTLTTLAPFFPLAFWPGVVGEFMFFLPVTIIITLFASLIVAYIINPIFAVDFMKRDEDDKPIPKKKLIFIVGGLIFLGLLLHLGSATMWANITLFTALSVYLHNIWGYKILLKFQRTIIPKLLDWYETALRSLLSKSKPIILLWSLIGLLIFTFVIAAIFPPKVVFFPDNEPNSIFTYIKLPIGTDVKVTDSVTLTVEKRIMNVLGSGNPIVESVISNVALGASEDPFDSSTKSSNKAKVAVNFVQFSERKGASTNEYMERIREALKGIPGAEINVAKEANGPPTGKPVNIEVSGDNLDVLIETANRYIAFLDSIKIPGADKFKTDFESTKPEIAIEMNRSRANHEGITSGHVGMELRSAVFGKESTKYREGEEQYPIQLRYEKEQRENLDRLIHTHITYRDMNTGILRTIPLSAVAQVKYLNSVGGISRINLKRVITINCNVITGYTANEVIDAVKSSIVGFNKPEEIEVKITGEQEDQKETSEFLSIAMLLSLCLILFILITQFNSIAKPIIIISEVLFSLIGVILGFIITGMPISIIMTGMGLVALAGIVVRNGILLVEFTDEQIKEGLRPREAMIQAGKARATPVLLTAASTILGLVPLAIGFNIDFEGLFTNFTPHIHFGGDNVMFFGPLSWTIIFGLTVATFLTLLMIPAMYHIIYAFRIWRQRLIHKIKYRR